MKRMLSLFCCLSIVAYAVAARSVATFVFDLDARK